jgi:hypothetical protein
MGKHGNWQHFTLQQQWGFLSSSIQEQQQATKRVRSIVQYTAFKVEQLCYYWYEWLAIPYFLRVYVFATSHTGATQQT